MPQISHHTNHEDRGHPIRAWLYRIVINLIRDRVRAFRPVAPRGSDILPEEAEPGLLGMVDELSEPQRVVILLKIVGGHTDREASEVLGRSEGAVKALYVRAIRNLRKKVPS